MLMPLLLEPGRPAEPGLSAVLSLGTATPPVPGLDDHPATTVTGAGGGISLSEGSRSRPVTWKRTFMGFKLSCSCTFRSIFQAVHSSTSDWEGSGGGSSSKRAFRFKLHSNPSGSSSSSSESSTSDFPSSSSPSSPLPSSSAGSSITSRASSPGSSSTAAPSMSLKSVTRSAPVIVYSVSNFLQFFNLSA